MKCEHLYPHQDALQRNVHSKQVPNEIEFSTMSCTCNNLSNDWFGRREVRHFRPQGWAGRKILRLGYVVA